MSEGKAFICEECGGPRSPLSGKRCRTCYQKPKVAPYRPLVNVVSEFIEIPATPFEIEMTRIQMRADALRLAGDPAGANEIEDDIRKLRDFEERYRDEGFALRRR